jgi:hypothetical protein
MLSPAEIESNRAAAIAAVRSALGLSGAPSSWTLAKRESYVDALAQYITTRPEQFSDQDLLNAELELKDSTIYLEDARFSWADFGSEVVSNAEALADPVVDGISSTVFATRYLIPLAALFGIAVGVDQLTGGGVRKILNR